MNYAPQPGTLVARVIKHLRCLKPGVKISTAELCEAIGQPSGSLIPSMQAARNHGMVRAEYPSDNRRTLYWSMGDGQPATAAKLDDDESEDEIEPKKAPPPPISARSVFDAARLTDALPSEPEQPGQVDPTVVDIPVPAPSWPAYREPNPTDAPPQEAVTEAAQDTGKESAEGHAEQRPPRDTDRPTLAQLAEGHAERHPLRKTTTKPEPAPPRFALWSDGTLQIQRDGHDSVTLPREITEPLFAYLDRIREPEVSA